MASAAAAEGTTAQVAAEGDIPPVAVEEFNYPDADKILAEKGIKLLKGDGHLLLADCDSSVNQIQVWTRQTADGMYCFRATGSSGYLTLEIPDVFAIQTSDRPVSADLTAEGKTQTVDVPKDDFKGVGEGVGGAPTVLVELRVTG
ncbi:hypothetical protein [Streptomyces peucetius]|uniref:Secreted protein n=1 Tax=Streptomyces peucetius TaxID=1950 RepID=A0ABY6I444_STRPE|nr:hypothetical protein [Streptomyces peucetius]UYQ61751.1 hypothetical protein OGH68_09790 [Streptomyces peucetius]